jgi:hypothetical protein
MPNRQTTAHGNQGEAVIGRAQELAERGYDIAKQAFDTTSERFDDLSRFGKQRPLLAMGVAFLAGFFVAKTFF